MESQTMTTTGRGVNGSAYLINGMSSSQDPMFIGDQGYRSSMNTLNRGGVVRTRPGYRKIFDLPSGVLQGLSYFKPLTAEGYYVFAIAGIVYASQFPFTSYAPIANIQFYAFAPQVFFCQTIQSSVLQDDGSIDSVPPVRILVMQDGGFTRAAYWDGARSGHLDPSIPATFQSVINATGGVSSVQVTYGGTGYSESAVPTITFQPPSTTTGTNFITATGHVTVDAGQIQQVIIDNPGLGYTFPPAIAISGQKAGPPLGNCMAWSGDRLWVAADNKVYASDITNPLAFTEILYATGGGFFQFTETVTAMAEIPAFQDPNLLVFTRNTSSVLQSSIRDRTTWQTTPDFQSIMFPGVGCTGQRSVTARFGELWWMNDAGFTNFNGAAQAKLSSYLVPQDSAMAVSKFNLSSILSGCAAASYENFIMLSVPYGDIYNQHTWVYDQAVTSGVAQSLITGPYQGSTTAWASYWAGTRPVEWATGAFNGVIRIAHVSVDYDGTNRLWAAFDPDRTDNGNPITCFLETKTHNDFGNMNAGLDLKRFVFAEINLSDILGPVNLTIFWGGVRGTYKPLASYVLAATEGSVVVNVPIGTVESFRSQVRRLRTPEVTQDISDPCLLADVENDPSQRVDWDDIGFSLVIQWEGIAAVRTYRIFVDTVQETSTGETPLLEYDPRILSDVFCL